MAISGAKRVKLYRWDSANSEWIKWDAVLDVGDIQIGAIELKDHDGTDRLEITSSNAAKVDGSAVTQPVSGTFWQSTQPISGTITANAGTNLNTSALLTETTWTTRVGEVQATPTANTILGRLKDISDGQLADSHNVTIDNASIAVTGTFWQTTQPVSGTFWQSTQPVSLASVPSHEVTNTGTFAIQVSDTSFAVADGNALGEGVLIQGDDGTDRKNINVDATTGDVQVDVTNIVTTDHDYTPYYQAAAAANIVVKGSAGFLHAIMVGEAVAASTIEVSDHASDGDGNVKVFLAGDTIGPAVYPVNMTMSTGICADIVNQTKVTFMWK